MTQDTLDDRLRGLEGPRAPGGAPDGGRSAARACPRKACLTGALIACIAHHPPAQADDLPQDNAARGLPRDSATHGRSARAAVPSSPGPERGTGTERDWPSRALTLAAAAQVQPHASSEPPYLGLGGRAELSHRQIGVSLRATTTTAATMQDEISTLYLARHAFGAGAHYGWQLARTLGWTLGAELGAVVYRRSTQATQEGWTAARSKRLASPFVGAETRLRWLPTTGCVRAGLQLALGVDVLARPPRLRYHADDGSRVRTRIWPVQPRASVGIVLQLTP